MAKRHNNGIDSLVGDALPNLSGRKSFAKGLSKVLIGSASAVAAVYLALSPRISTRVYSNMLFHPHKYPEGDYDIEEVNGIRRKDAFFQGPRGESMHAWLFETPGAQFTILFNHGNTGNLTGRMHFVDLLLKCGVSVFIYDYRGYGRSEGRPSVANICQDGVAAFDSLVHDQHISADKIILYGESLGAAVASYTASQRPSAGIILQSGFASLQKIGNDHLPFTKAYPGFLFPVPRLDNAGLMERDNRPLLIIHGAKDGVVPFSHAEEVFARAAEPKMFVRLPNATHNDICFVAADKYMEAVKDFVATLPLPASSNGSGGNGAGAAKVDANLQALLSEHEGPSESAKEIHRI